MSPDPDSAVLAAGQRIGVAFAPSLGDGTAPVLWRRLPSPILSVRTFSWDSVRVCNPAPLVLPNGTSTLLRDRTAPPYLLGYNIYMLPMTVTARRSRECQYSSPIVQWDVARGSE